MINHPLTLFLCQIVLILPLVFIFLPYTLHNAGSSWISAWRIYWKSSIEILESTDGLESIHQNEKRQQTHDITSVTTLSLY